MRVERDDQHASICVTDSGVGIAPDQLSRIFEMFVQGDTSLERAESGLGIGLTLVKQLAIRRRSSRKPQCGAGYGLRIHRAATATQSATCQNESHAGRDKYPQNLSAASSSSTTTATPPNRSRCF